MLALFGLGQCRWLAQWTLAASAMQLTNNRVMFVSLYRFKRSRRSSVRRVKSWSFGVMRGPYDEVLPLFKRAENNEQCKDGFHGQGGPLNVTYPRHESPFTKLFLEAAALHQIRLNPDYNGGEQEGAFEYQVTHKDGERCSAAKAYLTPNLSRKNLEVLTHAVSAKVVIENRRACGVSYYQGSELKQVRARREVILTG